MKRYGKYIRPYWYAFILGPLLMLTEVAGEVLLPSFMADIINIGAANHDVGYICLLYTSCSALWIGSRCDRLGVK